MRFAVLPTTEHIIGFGTKLVTFGTVIGLVALGLGGAMTVDGMALQLQINTRVDETIA